MVHTPVKSGYTDNTKSVKQASVDISFGDVVNIEGSTIIDIYERKTENNVDLSILAADYSSHTQEDLRETITQFQIDTAKTSGHFEDSSDTPVSVGPGNDAPKVKEGARFYINGLTLEITKVVGDGTADDAIEYTQLDGNELLLGTYDCSAIYGTMYTSDGKLKLSNYDIDVHDITGGGGATADSQYSASYTPSRAFDDNTSTMWLSSNSAYPHWIYYDLGVAAAQIVQSYQFMGYGSYSPRDFKFQGSNDAISWTDLDSQTDVAPSTSYIKFEIDNSVSYRYYRLYVTRGNVTSNYCGIKEIEMFETAERNYVDDYVTVTTTQSGFFSGLWIDINSGIITDNTNSQTVLYSVSFDGDTFRVFDGSAWRGIVSNDSTVHGQSGSGWYYRDNADTWASVSSLQLAISKAVQYSNNQMDGTTINAITDDEWNTPNGHSKDDERFDMSTTLYSDDNIQNPSVTSFVLNVDRIGYERATSNYIIKRISSSGKQIHTIGKTSAGDADIVIDYI